MLASTYFCYMRTLNVQRNMANKQNKANPSQTLGPAEVAQAGAPRGAWGQRRASPFREESTGSKSVLADHPLNEPKPSLTTVRAGVPEMHPWEKGLRWLPVVRWTQRHLTTLGQGAETHFQLQLCVLLSPFP